MMRIEKNRHPLTAIILFISKAIAMIAFVFLAMMMVFTVTDVVMRAVFNRPFAGSLDLIEFMMAIVGFLGLAWCAAKGRHIKVELLVLSLPKKTKAVIDTFNYLMCLIIFSIIAWQSLIEGNKVMELKIVSDAAGIPTFPFYWICSLGYGVLSLVILILLIQSVRGRMKG